jgi:sulfonate transport system ATP-binding protein
MTEDDGSKGVDVKIHGLSKNYNGKQVLNNLDLSLHRGEFVAIVGRSGCGKSTLLRHLIGLEQADSGEVFFNGEKCANLNADTRIMFQEDRLLPWKTVLGNVGLGLSGKWKVSAESALTDVGLAERANDWPAVLSGGQRQRVALARALAHSPRLLLLDEPMGALDALTRLEMQKLIERIWIEKKFTILLVTHDVGEAITLADRVILLESGMVAHSLEISIPRPRKRGSPEFVRFESEVLDWIMSVYVGYI